MRRQCDCFIPPPRTKNLTCAEDARAQREIFLRNSWRARVFSFFFFCFWVSSCLSFRYFCYSLFSTQLPGASSWSQMSGALFHRVFISLRLRLYLFLSASLMRTALKIVRNSKYYALVSCRRLRHTRASRNGLLVVWRRMRGTSLSAPE